jgi:hypothetical protein
MARSKLTQEIASKLEYYWEISSEVTLTDGDICARLGLRYNQLKNWLQTNAQVVRENGAREGISDIRARARARGITGYLQRHHALLLKAEAAGDLKTAHKILCWLEVKQFPGRFNTPPQRADPAAGGHTGVIEVPATIKDPEQWQRAAPKNSPAK